MAIRQIDLVMFCFSQHPLPLKNGIQFSSLSPHLIYTNIRISKKKANKRFSNFQVFFLGIGGISFHSLSSSFHFMLKLRRESQRGHRKALKPYHESKKILELIRQANAHAYSPEEE